MTAVLAAEWTKLRTLRSTLWTLALGTASSIGLGGLVGLAFRAAPDARVDPYFAGFYSLTLGQLGLVAFAVLAVGTEYGSGTIRMSLAAVPRRLFWYAGKALTVAVVIAGAALVIVPATFTAAQWALGPRGITLRGTGALEAAAGAWLYLVLISLFGLGVATMVRSSALALGILMPLLFLGSQGLGNIPGLMEVTQYLPDQLGMVVMHLAGDQGDPRWARDYGPWTGMGLLAGWTAAALAGGYALLHRRDA